MSVSRRYKLTDAIRDQFPQSPADKPDRSTPNPNEIAEQTKEARESTDAALESPSNRERMTDIGRGNQQSGRQGQ